MSTVRRDEQGMVSILVSMIMIIVISLIVIGFAQVSRRNQREALDNQLSTQAYYAAESGVNAAAQYFSNPLALTMQPTTDCKTFITGAKYLNSSYGQRDSINVLDYDSSTQYTCLMVNPTPGTLEATPVKQETNTVWRLANASGLAFKQLAFQWSAPATNPGTGTCATVTKFPSYKAWQSDCRFGILRVDLADTANTNAAALESGKGVVTFYLVPSSSAAATYPYAITVPTDTELNAANSAACKGGNHTACPAQIINANCPAGAATCKIAINLANGSTDYYARITMMYKDSADLIMSGMDNAGAPSQFKDAQALIDSTGQSQDELRRIQVRIPLNAPSSAMPSYSLMSTATVCKQINAADTVEYTNSCPPS